MKYICIYVSINIVVVCLPAKKVLESTTNVAGEGGPERAIKASIQSNYRSRMISILTKVCVCVCVCVCVSQQAERLGPQDGALLSHFHQQEVNNQP